MTGYILVDTTLKCGITYFTPYVCTCMQCHIQSVMLKDVDIATYLYSAVFTALANYCVAIALHWPIHTASIGESTLAIAINTELKCLGIPDISVQSRTFISGNWHLQNWDGRRHRKSAISGGRGSAVDFTRDLQKRLHETTRKPHCCELQRGNVAAVPSMKIKELIVAGEWLCMIDWTLLACAVYWLGPRLLWKGR